MDAQWFIQVSFWNWYDGFQGKEDGQQFIQHRFSEMNNLLVIRVMCKSNIDSSNLNNLSIDRISFQLLQYVYRISSQLLQLFIAWLYGVRSGNYFLGFFIFTGKTPLYLDTTMEGPNILATFPSFYYFSNDITGCRT